MFHLLISIVFLYIVLKDGEMTFISELCPDKDESFISFQTSKPVFNCFWPQD